MKTNTGANRITAYINFDNFIILYAIINMLECNSFLWCGGDDFGAGGECRLSLLHRKPVC